MKYFEADPYGISVLHNNILVKEIPEQEKINGVYIVKSETKRQFMAKGEVVTSTDCVKDIKGNVLYDLDLKPGDRVLYDNRAVQYPIAWEGEHYFVIRAEDVYCVIQPLLA